MDRSIQMPMEDKMKKCRAFFDELADILKEEFVVVGSCNRDLSAYLVQKGHEKEISYYGKPMSSFRISDHWNWYSNVKKCSNPDTIQCKNTHIPKTHLRDPKNPAMATKPRYGAQVAIYGEDDQYHPVYGEFFDQKTKAWTWVETTPAEFLKKIGWID